MEISELKQTSHRRYNPLLKEWILVSPQRTARPWLGKVEGRADAPRLAYDPTCYLCPGNARAGGIHNPSYTGTFVFDNDYPALLGDAKRLDREEGGLLVARSEAGVCRVVCFSPRHDLTTSRLSHAEMNAVVDVWASQYKELGEIPWVRHVQVFENRGSLMGASNPHPHCQIWANATVPTLPQKEQASFQEYLTQNRTCLLCDYLSIEIKLQERIVCQNDSFVVLVPFWAVWPFETLLVSKRHIGSMLDLSESERNLFSGILREITIRYDNLFETPFPYSMGFHQQPTDGELHTEWHFHGHYYPPLLRSTSIQKFMVGYEMLANPQRDITPESAAVRLRELPTVHYLDR